ncbi:DUF397 domain-containing protein [Allosalinactinospora lopnorensis]|uniref:DUF397 domain-containing protein n=1 Tax=Allosalinactinospora lopnorensis TaxID=1352348 RepID=UPI0009E4D389|nr:DUF397 domain-containing protein [Allosalinactinospora lopnorensis]
MNAEWSKSSYSKASGECVEAAQLGPEIYALRDSKHPHQGHLSFPTSSWRAFISSVKAEEL